MTDLLLTTFEAATVTRLARSTLAKLRVTGCGPRFIRLRAKILYRESDLHAWIDAHPRVGSTSAAKRFGRAGAMEELGAAE